MRSNFPHKMRLIRRCIPILILSLLALLHNHSHHKIQFNEIFSSILFSNFTSRTFVFTTSLSERACKIPEVKPFDKSIKHLVHPPRSNACKMKVPVYFNATLNSELVPVLSLEEFHSKQIKSCCYRVIYRAPDQKRSDFGYRAGLCYPISLVNATRIPEDHEFVAVFCGKNEGYKKMAHYHTLKKFIDVHSFVHLNPAIKEQLDKIDGNPPSVSKLNVILFGVDSVSRANFIRSMPKSFEYLKNEMRAIEMQGYAKVATNTISNLLPLLTNLTLENVEKECVKNKMLDKCPFIWNDFREKGYITAFADDSLRCAIFNIQFAGFNKPPTDYYFRPLLLAGGDYFREKLKGCFPCKAPRHILEKLLDYFKGIVHKMTNEMRSMFLFFWQGSLTHDDLNDSRNADEPLLRTLQWLKEGSYLNNTFLVVLSDHGMRMGPITGSRQGQLEDRLPFMYFVLPKEFKQTYRRAYKNLRGNSRRLVTSLDLHYTLKDLLNPEETITEEALEKREDDVIYSPQKGISMFLPIPLSRSCEHTIIEPAFCLCKPFVPVPANSTDIKSAANVVVKNVNKKLEAHRECAPLTLVEIKRAEKRLLSKELTYMIYFKTKPGDGEFEAIVKKSPTSWSLLGDVTRTNRYGNQSWCVDSRNLIQICYCRNQST